MKIKTHGFSLLTVMVVATLVGGISLAVMRLTSNLFHEVKTDQSNSEITTIINEIRSTLSDPKNCMATFTTDAINTYPPSNLDHLQNNKTIDSIKKTILQSNTQYNTGSIVEKYKVNQKYGNGRIVINDFTIKDHPKLGAGYFILEVNLDKGKVSYVKDTNRIIDIHLYNSKYCKALEPGIDSLWNKGTIDDTIVYPGESVGIGLAPTHTNSLLQINSSTKESSIYLSGNSPTNFSQISLASDGTDEFAWDLSYKKNNHRLVFSPNPTVTNPTPDPILTLQSKRYPHPDFPFIDDSIMIGKPSGTLFDLVLYPTRLIVFGTPLDPAKITEPDNGGAYIYIDGKTPRGPQGLQIGSLAQSKFMVLGYASKADDFGTGTKNGDTALTTTFGGDLHLVTRVGHANEPTRLWIKNNGQIELGPNPTAAIPDPLLQTEGRVHIGTSAIAAPASTKLLVEEDVQMIGNLQANNIVADHVHASSDRRLKTNIKPFTNALDKILSLNPIAFNWKDDPSGKKHLGLIAQEVEKTLPELVSTNSSGHKVLNYQQLSAVLLEAIHENQTLINNLKDEIKTTSWYQR